MSKFKPEDRYIVIKKKDAEKYLTEDEENTLYRLQANIVIGRGVDQRRPLDTVVVESDWPMYKSVWRSIEKWALNKFDGEIKHD